MYVSERQTANSFESWDGRARVCLSPALPAEHGTTDGLGSRHERTELLIEETHSRISNSHFGHSLSAENL